MNEQIPATTDLSLERILAPLVDVFPRGASAEVVAIYAGHLRPEKFDPADVREGVGRLIHIWDRTTFPPFAKLLTCCNEARQLRVVVERRVAEADEGTALLPKLSPAQIEAQLAEIRKFRLKVMPPKEPSIHLDREFRRKKLGIAPLTQAENDMLDRNRRERERRRNPPKEEK